MLHGDERITAKQGRGVKSMTATVVLDSAGSGPVDTGGGFPWSIHVFTIPLVLVLGIFIGWAMRDRRAANEDARRSARSSQVPAAGSDKP
jgi:hypothetical protein